MASFIISNQFSFLFQWQPACFLIIANNLQSISKSLKHAINGSFEIQDERKFMIYFSHKMYMNTLYF